MKLVSVLIPAYNSEKWISSAVDSVLHQSWKKLEIIIVDDGSTDNTKEIAESFRDSRIKVISQKNSGASAARNKAFRESQGDVIQYLDADDILASNKIAAQMPHLKEGVICSCRWGTFYDKPDNAIYRDNVLFQDLKSIDWIHNAWNKCAMMPPHTWLLNRITAEKAGPWNEELSLNDDGEYFTRVILNSKFVKFCPNTTVYYRFGNPSSLSRTRSTKALRSEYLATKLNVESLLRVNSSEESKLAAAQYMIDTNVSMFPYGREYRKSLDRIIESLDVRIPQAYPIGGKAVRWIAKVFGWKMARLMQTPYLLTKDTLRNHLNSNAHKNQQ